MGLATEDREALLELMPLLARDSDSEPVLAFARDHWRECLDELLLQPGFDQIRCALLRLMPPLLDTGERAAAIEGAQRALDAFPAAVEREGAALLLARHPAWVGLCAWELSHLQGAPEAAEERAYAAALAGFAHVEDAGGSGRGEILWALAEQAEGVGWDHTADALLGAAARGPFALATTRGQVLLLLGLRAHQAGAPKATELLEEVAALPDADPRARVHARWVLASDRDAAGDMQGAVALMREALDEVDLEEDADVAARIQAALEDLAGAELEDS